MPIFDSVSRETYDLLREMYDAKCEEYAKLFAAYEKLRPTHTAVSPMRVTLPQPDSGEQALRAAEAAVNSPIIRGIAANLMREKPGMSEADALREAKKFDDIRRGLIVPASVSANVPGAS